MSGAKKYDFSAFDEAVSNKEQAPSNTQYDFSDFDDVKKKVDGQSGGQELKTNTNPPTPSPSPSNLQEGGEKPSWQTSALNPAYSAQQAQLKEDQSKYITPPVSKEAKADLGATKAKLNIATMQLKPQEKIQLPTTKKLFAVSVTGGGRTPLAETEEGAFQGAEDYAKYIWDRTVETVGKITSGTVKGLGRMIAMGDDPNFPKEAFIKGVDELGEKARKKIVSPLTSNLNEKRKQDFDDSFLASTVASLPGLAIEAAVPYGVGFMADAFDGAITNINNTKEGAKLPESMKTIYAASSAAAMGILMEAGIDKIVGNKIGVVTNKLTAETITKLLSESEAPITKEAFDAAFKQTAKTFKNKLLTNTAQLGHSAAVGAAFMGSNEALNIMAEKAINKYEDKDVFEPTSFGQDVARIIKKSAEGAGFGLVMGGVHIPFNKVDNYIKTKVAEAKTPEDINKLKQDLAQNVQNRGIDANSAQRINNLIDEYTNIHSQIPAEVQNKKQVAEKIKQSNDLKQQATQTLESASTLHPAFQSEKVEEAQNLSKAADDIDNKVSEKPIYKIGDREVDRNTFEQFVKNNDATTKDIDLYVEGDDEMSTELEKIGGVSKVADVEAGIPEHTIKTQTNDKENIPGLPSKVGVGEEPVTTEPIKGAGAEEISTSGVLQAPGAEGEGKGIGDKVGEEVKSKTDAEIETRMSELEKSNNYDTGEFDILEKEMEKRERNSVFGVTLDKVNDAVDALMKKEKEMPNGYGSFIEKSDARETKAVATKYLNAKELTDKELKQDFSNALRGRPTTWYADGLKLRESLKEATSRGIDTKEMVGEAIKVYTDAGYDIETAKDVVAGMLKPVFEGSTEAKPELPQQKTVEQLRADEQAEYDAMPDPTDEAKRKEIYDKYDKLIKPLLKEDVGKLEVPKQEETKITGIDEKEVARLAKPTTDRMVEIEREFENKGYTIDTTYDNEIIVNDKDGEQVEFEDLPNELKDITLEYQAATAKLGEVSDKAREMALAESRKVVETEAEVVEPEKVALPEQNQEQVNQQELRETENLLNDGDKIRKEGKYVKDGVEYVRNEKGLGIKSEEGGSVRFTSEPGGGGVSVPFTYKLVESETLQPSHQDGLRNPNHFIWEAQPKNRNDEGSIQAEEGFANKPRFAEMGENTNAYSGAPVVNERGEVIQGNNRSAGLKKGYQRGIETYKKSLAENAENFGFTKEQVEGMKNPVLVREVAVSDTGAIELGNYDVKDLESGGKRRLDPVAITRRMPFELKGRIADLLFKGEGTLNQAIRENTKRLMELINPFLNQAQRNTIFKDGELTQDGAKDLETVAQHFLFDGGDTALPELHDNLSHTQKEGLRKSLPYIFSTGIEKSIVPEVQEAIIALNDFAASKAGSFDNWLAQSDMFNNGMTPKDKYSPTAIKLAEILNDAKNQKEITNQFGKYAELVNDKPATMFDEATKGISKKEGIKQIFKTEYDESKRPAISEGGGKQIPTQEEPLPQPSAEPSATKPTKPTTRATAEAAKPKPAEPKPAEPKPTAPEQTAIEKAREARKTAKEKLDTIRRGLGITPDPKKEAEALFEYHKALVTEAKEYIKEGVKSVEEWAKEVGEKVGVALKSAWDEASGKISPTEKVEDLKYTINDLPKIEAENIVLSKGKIQMGGEDVRGITVEENKERRKDLGMPERQPNPESFEQWDNEAKSIVENGYNMNNLIEKMERGEATTPVENSIRKIFAATIDKKLTENPSDEFLTQARRFIKASDVASSQAGKNLVSLKSNSNPLETITDFYMAKMDANGVDVLTEQQKIDVQEQFDKINAAKQEFEIKLKEAEDKNLALLAQNELLKQQKNNPKPKVPKQKKDFIEERQSLKDQLKQAIQKYKNNLNKLGISPDGGAENFAITVDMAKIIAKIAKSHVEEVGAKLSEVTKRTLDDVKDLFDGITEKDITNVIAGEYSEGKKTKSQLLADLNEIKSEAKLLNEYQRVLNGEAKTEKDKIKKNQKLVDLRKSINELKKEKEVEQYSDEAKAKRMIEANKKKEQQIREKLDNEDFEKEDKPKSLFENKEFKNKNPKLYKELLDSYTAKQNALHEYEVALLNDTKSKMSKGEQVLDFTSKAVNTTKKLVTGVDDSALFMQTLVAMMSRPITGGKAFVSHIKDAASQKLYERNLAELHNSPIFDLMQKSGLDITKPKTLSAKAREEAFAGESLDFNVKIKGKNHRVLGTLLEPFERAFTSLGNNMRAIAFTELSEKYMSEGYTFENNPKLFKDLAAMLNTETGRGKQNEYIEKASKLVTAGIWSPRLMASRLNILGISDVLSPFVKGTEGYYRKMSPEIRKQAIYSVAKFTAAIMALSYSAAYMFNGDVDNDPTSPGFMDIKIGDKIYNIAGGFAQYIRLIAQTIRGGKTIDGKFKEFRGGDRSGNMLHFLRGKLTPVAGTAANVISGMKDYVGQPVTVSQEIKKLTIPLSMQGVSKEMERDGVASIFKSDLPSFVGIGVKDKRDFKKEEMFTEKEMQSSLFKDLAKSDIEFPKLGTRLSYTVKSDDAHPKGVMTVDEYNKFSELVIKYSHDYTKENLSDSYTISNIKRLKELIDKESEDPKIQAEITELKKQIKSTLQSAHKNAIDMARDELKLYTK